MSHRLNNSLIVGGSNTVEGFQKVDGLKTVSLSGVFDVPTDDTTGAITGLSIPAGSSLLGAKFEITTAIAGSDATAVTLILAGGSTTQVGAFGALTAGTVSSQAAAILVSASAGTCDYALTGGTPTDPSAGTITWKIWYSIIDDA